MKAPKYSALRLFFTLGMLVSVVTPPSVSAAPKSSVNARSYSCDLEISKLRVINTANPLYPKLIKAIRQKLVSVKSKLAAFEARRISKRRVVAGTIREIPKADLDGKIISLVVPTLPPTLGGGANEFMEKYFERRYGDEPDRDLGARKVEMYRIKRAKYFDRVGKLLLVFFQMDSDVRRLEQLKNVCEQALGGVYPAIPPSTGGTGGAFATAGLPAKGVPWTGIQTVEVEAGTGVVGVTFRLDGQLITSGPSAEDTQRPFSVNISADALAAGAHVVTADLRAVNGTHTIIGPLDFGVPARGGALPVVIYGGSPADSGIALTEFGLFSPGDTASRVRLVKLFLQLSDGPQLKQITEVSLALPPGLTLQEGGTCPMNKVESPSSSTKHWELATTLTENCDFQLVLDPASIPAATSGGRTEYVQNLSLSYRDGVNPTAVSVPLRVRAIREF